MRTSVVICAHSLERRTDLGAALESVRAQSLAPLETIVVVDHNQALFEWVRERHSTVPAVENTFEPGLSGARNTGIAAARGEVIAFLDDDVLARPDWLERLTRPYEDPEIVGVGGAVAARWDAGRPPWFPREFDWVVGCGYAGLPDTARPIRNFVGANMSFRKEAFEALGGFSPLLGRTAGALSGCEETEFCIRLRRRHPEKALLYEPRAVVEHRVPESRASWRYFFARCLAEGRSKAVLTKLVGTADGLASERTHAVRVMTRAGSRATAAVLHRDRSAFGEAAALVGGLTVTTIGWASALPAVSRRSRAICRCPAGAGVTS